jgi:hypothetical protein
VTRGNHGTDTHVAGVRDPAADRHRRRGRAVPGLDGETAYATITVGSHRETWRVRSKGSRRWLIGQFLAGEDGRVPRAQAVSEALAAIEASAQFAGPSRAVSVRVAGDDRAVTLDLANEAWEAVEVTASGWGVVAEPGVRFRRSRGMRPLPRPEPGGSIEARPLRRTGPAGVSDGPLWRPLLRHGTVGPWASIPAGSS